MLFQETEADTLIVCTPNGLHKEHSIAAMKAGLHVICEKPMALSVADCKKMIHASKKYGKHLLVVKQNRYNKPVAALKKLVAANNLGFIYSIQLNCYWNRTAAYYTTSDWKGSKLLDGGALYTQFSHFIDLLYWLFGEIKTVKGQVFNRAHQGQIEIEDTGVFYFVTKSAIPGTLHFSNNSKNKNYEGSITVLAEKGTIKIGGPYLNTIEYQEPKLVSFRNTKDTNPPNKYKGYTGSMSNHQLVYREFLKLIAGKQANYTSGEAAIHTISVIEKFYHAAKRK
jgi:predicted dehydrogenase